jgi:LuxR family transcriptional regulator, maltose regulon positive regulatory protein
MESVKTARTRASVASVKRDRLLTLLRDEEAPLVVVRAPAGFGKTTLAEQWALRDPRPHRTVRIAARHNDPAALARGLIDAFESIGPYVSEIRTVATGAEPGFSALLLPAITRLVSSRQRPFVLVVDDVHLLTRPDCHAVLGAVVRGVPNGSQVALLTRDEPPIWLARERAEGRLFCLGPLDLAFDGPESRDFLDQLDVVLPPEVAADLVACVEGWPVALYLVALAIRAQGPCTALPSGLDVTSSDPFLRDYLLSVVLAGLDGPTLDFLRRTSVLEELSGPLCDAVLLRPDSAVVLSQLARHLQLVLVTDPQRSRYRYHHLLAEALRIDLETNEPWLVPQLHRRASGWHETNGDLDAAIRHAKAAHDLELTGRLVWTGVPACISSGLPDRLASWLGDLDDPHIRSDRWLSLAAAWLGLQFENPDRMTRWLLAAEDHAGQHWETRVATDVYAACLACIHILVGDFGIERSIALCSGAEQGLPRDSGFRAAALCDQGVALTLMRRFQEGLESLQRAERLARSLGVPIIEANSLAWQGILAVLNDDWRRGADLIDRAGALVEAHRLERLATSANVVTAVALLQAARGNTDDARTTLSTARRLTARVSQIAPWFAVAGPLIQARVAIILGEPALARALCTEARRHLTFEVAETLLDELVADTEVRLRALQDDQMFAQTLTTAQMRVLQFLPSRLTFDQIGEHLFLSRATIKSHATAVYRKLGASTRDEAVERARALGLLESPPVG